MTNAKAMSEGLWVSVQLSRGWVANLASVALADSAF